MKGAIEFSSGHHKGDLSLDIQLELLNMCVCVRVRAYD